MLIWMNIGLTVLCLLVAWLIAKIAISNPAERRGLVFGVFVVAFGALAGFVHGVVMPKMAANQAASQLEALLVVNPAFAALKKHDASGFAALVIPLKRALVEGRPEREVVAMGSNAALQMVKTYVTQASDVTAHKYMSSYVQMLTSVQERDLEACYDMLNGTKDSQFDLTQYVSANQLQAQYQAMAEVISSYATERQAVPQEIDIKDLLAPLTDELIRLYGKDVLMLVGGTSSGPKPDKKRMCQMGTAWLRLALRLPPADSGKLMRYLVAKN